jgi:hypothetical protein
MSWRAIVRIRCSANTRQANGSERSNRLPAGVALLGQVGAGPGAAGEQ